MADFQGVVNVRKSDSNVATIVLDAERADVKIGGGNLGGSLAVSDQGGREAVLIEPLPGGARIRVRGTDGAVVTELVSALNVAALSLGGSGFDGAVLIKNAAGNVSIMLSGRDADIVIDGADTAEDFPLSPDCAGAPPGSVMVLNHLETVALSRTRYDSRVAGIVSGGGDRRPGIVLGRSAPDSGRVPIALAGTVLCMVEATETPIAPGDLLTTSGIPGHAMRVVDRERAFGAVVGKALGRLERGQGSIPVLVNAC